MSDVECVVDCQNTLGEGPVWSVDEQKLYWVDIEKSELRCYDPATQDTEVWQTPERVGSFAVREQGGLLVAFESGLDFWDPQSGRSQRIQNFEPDLATTRTNDGRCDRQGRFIVGGMNEADNADPISNVYRLDPDLNLHQIISNVTCANSTCFTHRPVKFGPMIMMPTPVASQTGGYSPIFPISPACRTVRLLTRKVSYGTPSGMAIGWFGTDPTEPSIESWTCP
jgi:hypothetical protein